MCEPVSLSIYLSICGPYYSPLESTQSRDLESKHHNGDLYQATWFDLQKSTLISVCRCSCLFSNKPKISSIKKLMARAHVVHILFFKTYFSSHIVVLLLSNMSGHRILSICSKQASKCISRRFDYLQALKYLTNFSDYFLIFCKLASAKFHWYCHFYCKSMHLPMINKQTKQI